jgi:hypothetical protein
VTFLGDRTRPGLEPAAIAGFLLAVASAVMLARFGEADHPGQSPGGQEPRNAAVGSPTSA